MEDILVTAWRRIVFRDDGIDGGRLTHVHHSWQRTQFTISSCIVLPGDLDERFDDGRDLVFRLALALVITFKRSQDDGT